MRLDDPRTGSDWIAPDCAGMDFFAADQGLRDLLAIYLPVEVLEHLTPHYQRLGQLAGGRLDDLARTADRHPPVLHARDRFGRDQDWIEYHPAYRDMEQIAFGDFQFHAMSHRAGVMGMDRPLPPVAKYAFQYLFVQGEFGLMCGIMAQTQNSDHRYDVNKCDYPGMADPHVLSSLSTKRAEIDGELRQLAKRVELLRADRDTVDAAIRIFDPARLPHKIKPHARRLKPKLFRHGECARAIMGILREASEPVTVRQVVERLIEEYHLDLREPGGRDALIANVRATLSRYSASKALVREQRGELVLWRVG